MIENFILTYGVILITFIFITIHTSKIKPLINQDSSVRTSRRDEILLTSVIVTFVLGILIIILSGHFNFLAIKPNQIGIENHARRCRAITKTYIYARALCKFFYPENFILQSRQYISSMHYVILFPSMSFV